MSKSRLIDCEFTILASHGPVKMGDTKEGTFAIRVVKALDSPPGRLVNSNGAVGEKAIWGKRADWVDDYGHVAGEDVGIAIFDSPKNPPPSDVLARPQLRPAGGESVRLKRVHP